METLVALNDAHAGYSGARVLKGVSLSIGAGERVAIMGRSGAGKSTLLNLIYRTIGGEAALIPQAAALVGSLSVFHNVYMGRLDRRSNWCNLRTLVWPARNDIREIERVLELVGLSEKLFEKAGALSGGQQQRTSVARALYNSAQTVIGDEPVSALDRLQAADILTRLRERHRTVIVAMHDVGLALEFCDRILMLDDGRIVIDAPAKTLRPADLMSCYGG